ncbi:hypothetical protein ACOMHN_028606 [Nucella lapillus]
MDFCNSGDQRRRTRLSFDPKARFPAKLFDVANDGYLLTWNSDGTGIIVDEAVFEKTVMYSYPGFVQIASFLNLRRLFREYSFDWQIVEGTVTVFQFSHPAFIRDREDLLDEVRTKRKSGRDMDLGLANKRSYVQCLHGGSFSPKELEKCQYRSRRYSGKNPDEYADFSDMGGTDSRSSLSLTAARSSSDSSQGTSCYEHCGFADQVETPEFHQYSTGIVSSVDGYDSKPTQQDLLNVLAVYAKNELSEEEYFQLLAKTAIEGQVDWNADAARESISSQSVPSLSEEYVPFDQSRQSPNFQRWEERNEFSEVFDVAENQNQLCNDEVDIYEQKNVDIFPLHSAESAATASDDYQIMSQVYKQGQCENAHLPHQTDFNTTLCELRPGVFYPA